jgi:hypothetical protein
MKKLYDLSKMTEKEMVKAVYEIVKAQQEDEVKINKNSPLPSFETKFG